MALQRNLKALGTFGFQTTTRGNPVYIQYIPRTLNYVAGQPRTRTRGSGGCASCSRRISRNCDSTPAMADADCEAGIGIEHRAADIELVA